MRSLGSRRAASAFLAVSLGAFGLVAVTTASAGAAGTPCQQVFSSGTLDAAIPDQASYSSGVDVPEDGLVVSDVNLTVNLHHTYDADLEITLFSETEATTLRGSSRVFNHSGFNGDNLIGTVFDDSASTAISWGDAPFTGRFVPNRTLTTLNGFTGGRYELLVSDTAAGDTGTLNDWSLTISYASCDFDSDGVEDHVDSCLGVTAHTATGCPLTTRSLTSSYRKGKFKGSLSSPVPGCKASRSVTIWKVRSGPDRRIGTAVTRSDGFYRLVRARHTGRYYATSPRTVVTDVAECAAAQSAIFRIR